MIPESGHHNGTFYFAGLLQKHGYRVIYASVAEIRHLVEANGFEFYEILPEDETSVPMTGKYGNKFLTAIQKMRHIIRFREGMPIYKFLITNYNHLEKLYRDTNPDLIIIDRCYDSLLLNAIALGIKVCKIETTVCLSKIEGIPPYNSYFIPNFTWFSNLVCEIQWAVVFLSRKIDEMLYGSVRRCLKDLAMKVGYPPSRINTKRIHNVGFDDYPELIVSPREFDFPHIPEANQIYIGPSLLSLNKSRNEKHRFINPYKESEKPLVYCAMGSLSYRYDGIEVFFERLINVFKKRPQYNLIVCISNDALRLRLSSHTVPNIAFFKAVPQINLLKEVSVMINHGGMNSITECILSEVPMLVYPGTSHLDQYGNAARVAYHGVGLRGKLKKDREHHIADKMEKLISNPFYKKNITTMKNKILKNKNYEMGPHVIATMLKDNIAVSAPKELIVSEFYYRSFYGG